MSKKGLLKSGGVIGIATGLSRVLGFIRDIIFALFFGTSLEAQAFLVAFRIPNSLRDLVGEGATNAAIVPVLTEYKSLKGDREFLHAVRVIFNIFLVVLSVLTILGILFSPLIVRLMAPGFVSESVKFDLTVRLNRVIFPYLIFIGLTAYFMGVLNTLKHFAMPAFGPCLMNLALIASTVWLYPRVGVMGLAVGVLVGGALQLLLNIPAMHRKGITLNLRDGFIHPAAKRIGKLLVPRMMGTAVYQINIFVDTIIASFSVLVGAGGVAALYYANRLIQFPLAIFGLALAQAALPRMSQEFAMNDMERFKDTLSFSLRVVFLIMVPSSVGLAILGEPIVRILFERGEFTAYSTSITSSALLFYSIGIFAYGGVKLLVSSFYSMHDTMTPVKTAFAAVIINIIFSLTLVWPLKLGGLALATSISATFNFISLYVLLEKRIGDIGTKQIVDSFLRALIASLAMAAVLIAILRSTPDFNIISLIICMLVGPLTFAAAGYIIKIREIGEFLEWIKRRK
ncbi:MAG: murein biosynthesis integral membrane protein MurJ [Candidatus Omnitrophota bacterium]|jgi:putative peptidoglycan lipid II flippase